MVSGYHNTELSSEWPSAVQSCPLLHTIIHSDRTKCSLAPQVSIMLRHLP